MELTSLNGRLVEWLRGGPEGDVVLSSRVRLARNVDGYTFVTRASNHQRARVEELLRNALLRLDGVTPLTYWRLDTMEQVQRELLTERHLIRSEHADADWVRGVALDDNEQLSFAVNDEDHLRIQVIYGGLRLHKAARKADTLDDGIAKRVPFAYSARFGYLTSSPTNTGTGLRAGVMLHLPGLVMNHELDRLAEVAGHYRVRLQGVYGEAYHGSGDIYQLSNIATLGLTEDEIIDSVAEVTGRVVEMERAARRSLIENHEQEFLSRVDRARDLLYTAGAISSQESLCFLSQIRMAQAMNLIDSPAPDAVRDLFLLTLPAHLQTMEGRVLEAFERNELRAAYIRSRLCEE